MSWLTNGQAKDYREHGFLIVRGFVDAAECHRLRSRARELVESMPPNESAALFSTLDQTRLSDTYFLNSGDKVRYFFEPDAFSPEGVLQRPIDQSVNKIGHALHELDPIFSWFSHSLPLMAIARDLGLLEPVLLQSMYIFKAPGIGGQVVPHQDNSFLYTEPQSATGFWLAMEDAHRDNGCMWTLPGAHTGPLRRRFVRTPDDTTEFVTLDDTPFDSDGWIPLEVPAGSLVILHGNLPHRSEANRSTVSRQAYSIDAYAVDAACRYPKDNWLQRDFMPLLRRAI